jgi:hypothetical protein
MRIVGDEPPKENAILCATSSGCFLVRVVAREKLSARICTWTSTSEMKRAVIVQVRDQLNEVIFLVVWRKASFLRRAWPTCLFLPNGGPRKYAALASCASRLLTALSRPCHCTHELCCLVHGRGASVMHRKKAAASALQHEHLLVGSAHHHLRKPHDLAQFHGPQNGNHVVARPPPMPCTRGV